MIRPADERSFAELISDALSQLTALVRNEIQLAKAEVAQKANKAAIGLAMLAAGAALAIATLVMVLFTVAALLSDAGLPAGVSALIATLLGAGVAVGLAWMGIQKLKAEALLPERTMRQLNRDTAAAKEQMR